MKTYAILAGISLAVGLSVGAGIGHDYADTKCSEATAKRVTAALNRSNAQYKSTIEEKDKLIEAKESLAKAAQNEANRINDENRALIKSSDGLRSEIRRLFTGLAANNCDPSAIANGEAEACTPRVLAQLFEASGELAGIYALEATSARQTGLNCEAEYKALQSRFDLCVKSK